jgi:hypothetical protein
MIEHMTDLLGAYADGELRGPRLRQVENHLQGCAVCRKELEELQSLSNLLQKSVPMDAFMPADRFAANLVLQLSAGETRSEGPRQAAPAQRRNSLSLAWALAPMGVLGAWVFVQAVFTVSAVLSTADLTGLLGNAAAFMENVPQQSLWFSATMNLFGGQIQGSGRTAMDLLNGFSVFGSSLTTQLLIQAGIAAAYWAWLVIWWTRRRAKVTASLPGTPRHS